MINPSIMVKVFQQPLIRRAEDMYAFSYVCTYICKYICIEVKAEKDEESSFILIYNGESPNSKL
jgi:hypothetical protein